MAEYDYIGSEVKRIRKEMGISQAELAEKSNVSIDTIRRLENGYNLPRLDSIVPIFKVLGIEWELLLKTKKGSSWQDLQNILEKASQELDQNNLGNIFEYISQLTYYRDTLPTSYKIKLDQYLLFFQACLSRSKDKNLNLYKKYLEDALSLTIKSEDLLSESSNYNELEIRILQSLSEYYIDIEDNEKAFKILNHLKEVTPTESKLFPKICYNLARYYYIEKKYTNTILLCKVGIEEGSKISNYNSFPLLYYMIGISKYKIGELDYRFYLDSSLKLCDLLLKNDLKKVLILSIDEILQE